MGPYINKNYQEPMSINTKMYENIPQEMQSAFTNCI